MMIRPAGYLLPVIVAVMVCAGLLSGCSVFDRQPGSPAWAPHDQHSPDREANWASRLKVTASAHPKEPTVDSSKTEDIVQASHVVEMTPVADVPPTINVHLNDVITATLQNNLHLRVLEKLPDEVGKRSQIEQAQFDTSMNTSLQYLQGTQQVSSALQAVQGGLSQYSATSYGPAPGSPNLVSVEKRFSSGTTARVGLGSNYNMNSPMGQFLLYNPAYQSAGSLVVEQALFRGRSQDANLAGIRIAQSGARQSAAEFQIEVNQTLFDVQRAYWAAWLAQAHVENYQEIVSQAQATLDIEQKRLELGQGGIVPVAQATESLQSLKAELAQAEQRQRTARNQLLSLMGLPAHDDRTLTILDRPVADPVEPSLDYGLAAAVQQRPELQVRQHQTSQARLELERRKNFLQPDVRAYAGYSLTGLNNNLLGSVNRLTSADFGNMSLGVRYSYILGQRAERAAVEQAELAMTRQVKAQAETEFLIQRQVREAHDNVKSNFAVYLGQRKRLDAARVQVDTFEKLHAAGEIDLDRLLRARIQWLSAEQQVRNSLIDYNLALNSWRFATGEMTTSMMESPATTDSGPVANQPARSEIRQAATVKPTHSSPEDIRELLDTKLSPVPDEAAPSWEVD